MKTLFAVTHVGRNGLRTLTLPNQGRNHFDTFEKAQEWLDGAKESLREKVLGDKADTLEVRAVECYDHGDAKKVYFD